MLWHSRYMSASSSGDPFGLPAATCKTPAPVSARPPANTASSRVVGDATSRPDSAASVLMSLAGQVDGRPISMIESDAEIDDDASDASSFGCDGSPAHPLRPLHPGFNVATRERVQRQERNKYGPGSISTADLVKEVDSFEDSDYVHEESPQPLSDKKPPASSTLTPGEEKALSMLQCDIFGARDEAEVKELEWQRELEWQMRVATPEQVTSAVAVGGPTHAFAPTAQPHRHNHAFARGRDAERRQAGRGRCRVARAPRRKHLSSCVVCYCNTTL